MQFHDTHVDLERRYSLGTQTAKQRPYLSIPVSNGVVDYEEYYALSAAEYATLRADPDAAAAFADACRRRECDERLIQAPGTNRGTPV